MKKVICLILSLIFVFSLCACQNDVVDKTKEYENKKEEVVEKVEQEVKKIEVVEEENLESVVEEKSVIEKTFVDDKNTTVINYIEDATHFRERIAVKSDDYEGVTAAVCEKMGVDYNYVIKSIEVKGEELKTIYVDFFDYDLDLPEHFNLLLSLGVTYTMGMDIEDVYYLEDGKLYEGGPDGFFISKNIVKTEWPEVLIPALD